MSDLNQWALRHNVPYVALNELRQIMGLVQTDPDGLSDQGGESEAAIQKRVQLTATRAGWRLWRNNVGALKDSRGVPVRYGLANDSAALNKVVKSSDLVGIKPVLITPDMVGHTLGQFVAREVKAGGWKYSGSSHERAQLKFIELVVGLGGDACFICKTD
jgi:hypothetical protein